MLFQTVHMPSVYKHLADGLVSSYNFRDILSILEHAVDNCIMLDDIDGTVSKSIGTGISRWPYREQKKAEELWSFLKSKRLVKLHTHNITPHICQVPGCHNAIELTKYPDIEMVLISESCHVCRSLPMAIEPSDYIFSPFLNKCKATETIELNEAEWTKSEFEQRVWHPLFRHARIVKIYDRYIGRSIKFQKQPTRACKLKDSFQRGLNWLIEQYASVNKSENKQLEIYCGTLSDPYEPWKDTAVVNLMKIWEQELTSNYKVAVRVKVIRENSKDQMPHRRVLITNQTAIMIERGFDLLREDNHIQNVMISRVQYPEKYEKEIGQMSLVDIS